MLQNRRTDLALEAQELWQESAGEQTQLKGVQARDSRQEGYAVTTVRILDQEGAQALGKPAGTYVTLTVDGLARREEDAFGRAVRAVAAELTQLLAGLEGPVLVACLGNRAVTPDAVGPKVHDHLLITRHLVDQAPEHFGAFRPVASVAAGVLGTTGVESGEIVKAVADKIAPRAIIAVDALAARRVERLCATVQVCDSGIAPGSGVGNHRFALNAETMGVPVIAVGVPTVVDGATLCADLLEEAGQHPDPQAISQAPGATLMVTPRDIDQRVEDMAKVIGYALSLSLQPALDLESLQALIE